MGQRTLAKYLTLPRSPYFFQLSTPDYLREGGPHFVPPGQENPRYFHPEEDANPPPWGEDEAEDRPSWSVWERDTESGQSPSRKEGGLTIFLYLKIEFVVILKHNYFAKNDAPEANWHIWIQVCNKYSLVPACPTLFHGVIGLQWAKFHGNFLSKII